MAHVLPFRGVRYNAEKVGDLAAVFSPPYDVISADARRDLHRRHPHNVIRLILGEDRAGDDGTENRHLRARRSFQEWEASGILLRDPDAAFYVYEQQYLWKRKESRVRLGLIGAVRLEEYGTGVVFPHEHTMPAPKADRLQLMQALPVDLEQIFCFYPGPSRPMTDLLFPVTQASPLCDFGDGAGVRHRVWMVRDRATIAGVAAALRDRPLFIADGHHRYETALAFRDQLRRTDATPAPGKAYNFVMMTLVSVEDRGLTHLPTHRLIQAEWGRAGAEILSALTPYFLVEERRLGGGEGVLQKYLDEMEERGRHGHVFGLYTGGETLVLLTMKDRGLVERLAEPVRGTPLLALDVVILEHIIFQKLLDLRNAELIRFTQDEGAAVREVQEGRAAAAFFLNPTPLSQITAAVTAGERLPPKSTYFYPKLLSGLVFFKVDPTEVLDVSVTGS